MNLWYQSILYQGLLIVQPIDSSSKTSTDIEEKYIVDDMSSLTNISDMKVSNAPQKHEYGKERMERKGNIYDKLYNTSLKGQLNMVKDILKNQNAVLGPDENGQTPLYAACIGNHLEIIALLIDSGYDVNHQDNEGKTPAPYNIRKSCTWACTNPYNSVQSLISSYEMHRAGPLCTLRLTEATIAILMSSAEKFLHQDMWAPR